ncbi:putative membrane protein [Burkholderia thailandensis]|nr:putative membrane protein [Burkholderia thailandensis]
MSTSALWIAAGCCASWFFGFLLGKTLCLVENFFNDTLS